jgi:uncharacterized membrane protein YjjB (DUF3815 family)
LPPWTDYVALLVGAVAFAILFRAALRDWPAVIGAVIVGYLATRWGGEISGSLPAAPFGVFLGGLLLVPGSVGFRSMSFLLERDTPLGLDTAMLLLTLLVSIVAGLMFGDLLISPRRSL